MLLCEFFTPFLTFQVWLICISFFGGAKLHPNVIMIDLFLPDFTSSFGVHIATAEFIFQIQKLFIAQLFYSKITKNSNKFTCFWSNSFRSN